MTEFNQAEWQAKAAAMTDDELRAAHSHHLNYVPNSPVSHITFRELQTRNHQTISAGDTPPGPINRCGEY